VSDSVGRDAGTDRLVSVDPRFAPEHAAYYLIGLLRHVEVTRLPLDRSGFIPRYSDYKPVAFLLQRGGTTRRIFIGPDDMPELDLAALEWADVYGKVNLAPGTVPAGAEEKVVSIGPSHALKIWGPWDSFSTAIRTHVSGGRIVPLREHYRRFWLAYRRRVGEDHYSPEPADDRYVFYNAWLWSKHREANPPRAEFIRACRDLRPRIEFEGGFIARRRDDMPEYADLVATHRYSLPEYLQRIKRSTVVFNNPAVHNCHGWKLAEFLRLGKAIVSLPLSREMPAPFLHGQHAHFVDGSRESIQEAVLEIVADREYRTHLERSARAYFEQYLAPERVIARLADAAFAA
jgi:hypothetical protein